jgi:alpha-mannosidase
VTVTVHMVGNAHLDPVWLWGWQSGGDEVLATFRAAADRLDEYPEFVFTAGEAWRYELTERLDPDLFARIEGHVADGRWSPVGGQYMQPDCNLPTRAALLRQYTRGQRFFVQRFGVRSRVGFNPDTFGHPGALPDILAEAGLGAYAFHRPSREQLPLPADVFRWRGPAGGEVVGCRIVPSYVTRSSDLRAQIEICLEHVDRSLGHAMCFYGVGDHGGGPTKAQIEYILAHRDAFEGAELRFSTPDAFYDAIVGQRGDLPVVEGELQHVFPGCYSVMHDIKQAQRRTESLLEQAGRVIETCAPAGGERDALEARLDSAWDDVLFTAFHDILAGTSVDPAWSSVRAMQGRAQIVAEEVVFEATRRSARRVVPTHEHVQILVFNPDRETWRGLVDIEPWIDLDDWRTRWVSDVDGRPQPYQIADAECDAYMVRVLVPAKVAPSGWTTLLVRDDAGRDLRRIGGPEASRGHLAGDGIRLELGLGGVERIVRDGRDVLGPGGISLHLRADASDTWTMTADRLDGTVIARLGDLVWSVEEDGPLRARVRGEGVVGGFPVALCLTLEHGSTIVRIDLEAAMFDRCVALQLTLDLPAEPSRWTDSLAGSPIVRTPGPAEFPVGGWSRVTAGGTDTALVTHDAYSLSLDGRAWQWTLLRTPRMAWPPLEAPRRSRPRHTDQGEHRFAFLLAAEPELPVPLLDRLARQFAQPPVCFSRTEGVDRPPWGDVPPRQLWTQAEKRAAGTSDDTAAI